MLDIAERLGAWVPEVQGQYINVDWEPESQGFGAQCWDLAAHWSQFLGLPVINTGGDRGRWPGWAGNMVDAFPQTAAIAAAYDVIAPTEPGLPGDIVVWDDSYPVWFPKTHVAVLLADKGAQLLCMSQNSIPSQAGNPYPEWSTGPTTIQYLPRRGLLGFIRPRTGINLQGSVTPTQEDDEMASADVNKKLDDIFTAADTGRSEATNAKIAALDSAAKAGTAASEATNAKLAARESAAGVARIEAALAALPATVAKILLGTVLEAPDGSGRSYTVADYLTYGWWYAMQAKDAPAGGPVAIDPAALSKAIEASAAAVASQLQITVKE